MNYLKCSNRPSLKQRHKCMEQWPYRLPVTDTQWKVLMEGAQDFEDESGQLKIAPPQRNEQSDFPSFPPTVFCCCFSFHRIFTEPKWKEVFGAVVYAVSSKNRTEKNQKDLVRLTGRHTKSVVLNLWVVTSLGGHNSDVLNIGYLH